MATSPSLADSPVPDWVRRNGEIFRTPPHGTDRSKRSTRSFEPMVEQKSAVVGAAMVRANMSEDDGLGAIDPPAFLPPASYYKDVRNHANIVATMLVTARRQVGFEPSLAGQELSDKEMQDFTNKFFKWNMELDNYWPYIEITDSGTRALWFRSDENLIRDEVSNFVASFWGLNDEVAQVWTQALTGMVKSASAYVTQNGANVSQVSFQTDIVDTSGKKDPRQPLTFGRTVQSDPPNGKYDSVLTSGTIYLINSSAIIDAADDFAKNGVTIFGAKPYVDYVNSANI